jgi:T5orf172 domain
MERAEFLSHQGKVGFAPHAPCEHGHVFWLSTGHCVECCSPAGLLNWKKQNQDGWVYIASSENLRLHKIGASINRVGRARQLKEGYGGAHDWIITYRRNFRNHGRIEGAAIASLMQFAVRKEYIHRGKRTRTRELFNCAHGVVEAAIEAFAADAIGPNDDAGKILMRWK